MIGLRGFLEQFAAHLPSGGPVFYLRRLTGDRPLAWVARGAEALTGHSVDSLVSASAGWFGVVHPEDRDRVRGALQAPPGEIPEVLEYRILTASGELRWVQDRIQPAPVREGASLMALGMWTDVTERRALEHQVSVMEERLWQSQRVESVGALAGGIAHDFNNLLTAILSSVQLIAEQPELQPEVRQDLLVIRTAAERGGALVQQILGFSSRAARGSNGGDLARSLRELEGILRRTLGEDVTLRVRIPPQLWSVKTDTVRMEQVILNLAVNAREAMDRGGVLEISVDNVHVGGASSGELEGVGEEPIPGDHVRLRVRDTGRGIPEAVRGRIFDAHFSTKNRPEGGLGLATVRKIVRSSGGAIRVSTRVGEGTIFDVYLPALHGDARALADTPVVRVESAPPGRLRILVVEDDPGVRALVERTLARLGHQAVGAASAAEALRVFDRLRPPFDLVLTDIILPDRPGTELHRALTRRVPGLPVVFMSGYGEEALESRGGGPVGAPFLPKPFSPEQLRAVIQRALGMSPGSGEDGARVEPGSG
jgi:two-component system, cell cycle sensor histidine kinase and response regulator CckA